MKPIRILICNFFAILLFGAAAARPQDKPPTAEEILNRFVQATGGPAAYEKHSNEISRGTVEFVAAGIKGTIATYRAAPDKAYRIIELPGFGKIERGTDGRIAWEISSETGARVKDGDEKAADFREASFNAPLRWRELYRKVELAGQEKVDDRMCFKLVLTPKEGKPVTQYYDSATGLLFRISTTVSTPTLGEIATETTLGDYRSEDGILIAHELINRVLTQEIHIHIETVQFNADFPADRFDLPAAIRDLVRK